ncbi:PaaX family transcriptional regulator [Sulfitobacter sp. F26204]|uniref:PaaX family transcriptional regulator C-terminal domain-containing protein n=1 Tax=Sulfitobacter sp. F26204 TaxID=2996014 RepID=UPI00225E55CF|nr:PaaX family transcriptional regulator C-terminal domain-containing protein [Sulfitobacter sp. F26204]MCX7558320.1 PaaX family transcriptional regulator [Sulfitobacter sp. F26204]
MPTEAFNSLTAGMRDLGGQRVWSLMISLFGDLAQDTNQSIDGPVLSEIMAGLHVKPEATRVALHRLRNDGWITSAKSGRISHHSLSERGRAQCAQANPRIYSAPTLTADKWQLVLTETASTEQATDMAKRGFTQVTSRVFAGPMDAAAPQETLSLSTARAPEWLRQQIASQTQVDGYQKLFTALVKMQEDLPDATRLSPIEIAVLRCLIVHNWRRLVLKHARLPLSLIGPDSPAQRCHLEVAQLLARYPRPALTEIERYCSAA